MCAMISGLFIGSNDGRPPQAYKENIVSLTLISLLFRFSPNVAFSPSDNVFGRKWAVPGHSRTMIIQF